MADFSSVARYGVYGLTISGLEAARHLMTPQTEDAPIVRVSIANLTLPEIETYDGDRFARHQLLGGGRAELDRLRSTAKLILPRYVSDQEVLHPWLASAAATFSTWNGRNVLHGCVVGTGSGAVALIGDRESGKSSTLAWLTLNTGFTAMSDDLAVVDEDRHVYSGPSCIDLRPAAAPLLGEAAASLVRKNSRLRLELSPGVSKARLRSIVILAWAPTVGLERIAPARRLAAISPHASLTDSTGARTAVLDLLAIPTYVLSRPRTWTSLTEIGPLIRSLLD